MRDFALTVSRLLSAARLDFLFSAEDEKDNCTLGGNWLWGQAEHGLDDLHGGRRS